MIVTRTQSFTLSEVETWVNGLKPRPQMGKGLRPETQSFTFSWVESWVTVSNHDLRRVEDCVQKHNASLSQRLGLG